MGTTRAFTPEKLIIGVLLNGQVSIDDVTPAIEHRFGPMDFLSPVLPFEYTDYYCEEMGKPLWRCFFAFAELVPPDRLAEIKLLTNRIEAGFSTDRRRNVNLDPGLISLDRLVLASTKDNGRRIPLAKGIYGEVTLVYIDKAFRPLEWTYPDYRSDEYRFLLGSIRTIYRNQLKQMRG